MHYWVFFFVHKVVVLGTWGVVGTRGLVGLSGTQVGLVLYHVHLLLLQNWCRVRGVLLLVPIWSVTCTKCLPKGAFCLVQELHIRHHFLPLANLFRGVPSYRLPMHFIKRLFIPLRRVVLPLSALVMSRWRLSHRRVNLLKHLSISLLLAYTFIVLLERV